MFFCPLPPCCSRQIIDGGCLPCISFPSPTPTRLRKPHPPPTPTAPSPPSPSHVTNAPTPYFHRHEESVLVDVGEPVIATAIILFLIFLAVVYQRLKERDNINGGRNGEGGIYLEEMYQNDLNEFNFGEHHSDTPVVVSARVVNQSSSPVAPTQSSAFSRFLGTLELLFSDYLAVDLEDEVRQPEVHIEEDEGEEERIPGF